MLKWLKNLFKSIHKHKYEIKYTMEEVWLECNCKSQKDVPDDRLDEVYQKLRNRDTSWKE